MQNQSPVQKYTVTLTWDDNVLIDGIKGSSSKTYEVKRGSKWSAPISFEYGYQLRNVVGATMVNGKLVVDSVTSNININVTSEAVFWTITYNLTNIEKGNPAPNTVRHGENFYAVLPALDNYSIDTSSIRVTNCESWNSQELIDKNTITQTTVYITKANGNVVITASAIGLYDSYNVNILTQPINTTILTSYIEDTNLSETTTFTGSIYDEKKIYIYLPWKYNWMGVDIYINDENKEAATTTSITDPVEVTIDGSKYTKAVLTITTVENYQTPDIEILITAEEKKSYTISYNVIDGIIDFENKITTIYEGDSIVIKPIVTEGYKLTNLSIIDESSSDQSIFINDEDGIASLISNGINITPWDNLEISAGYYVTISWSNLENYTIKEQSGTASKSGSTSGPSGILYYFIAETDSGYMFENPKIITSDKNAVVNISNTSDASVSFSVMTSVGTTIEIEGVTQTTTTSYAPLNIEVTNNAFAQTATFNMRQFQGDSYPGITLINNTKDPEFIVISGFDGNEKLTVGSKSDESYNKIHSALDYIGNIMPINSIEIRMYGDIQDANLSSLSKKQIVYATVYDSVNNITHTSTNQVEIDGNNYYSSGQYTLTFDQLLAIDSTNPLTLHYIINE